jgi:hypothetical protein
MSRHDLQLQPASQRCDHVQKYVENIKLKFGHVTLKYQYYETVQGHDCNFERVRRHMMYVVDH